jgi:hypothetical protein
LKSKNLKNLKIFLAGNCGGNFCSQKFPPRPLQKTFEIFDPFCGEKNQAELSRRIDEIEAGKNLAAHELIEDE